jgi:tRNA threonylcarbamoyladenosine biosynthesis protein TsaE
MDSINQIITKTAQETAGAGEKLATALIQKKGREASATVLCLYGDLGSGKTTFTQGFAKGLGFTGRLLSPTFIIVRRYQIPRIEFFLYHIDLYRTKTVNDIESLGFSEIIQDSQAFVIIEWAEKLESLMPRKRIDMHFSLNKDDSHTILIGRCHGS